MSDRMIFKFHFEYLNVKVTNDVGKMRHKLKNECGMRNHPMKIIYNGLFIARAIN